MITITPYDSDGNAVTQLYQWDRGITLYFTSDYITEALQVHFASKKSGTAYVVEGTYSDGTLSAVIPSAVLDRPYNIYGYIYTSDDDEGRTILIFTIDIEARAKPSDYTESDSDDYVSVSTMLAEIQELLEQTEDAATAAATSESNAADSATLAESWAVGGTGTRDGEDADNAKYYAEIAGSNAADALGFYWDTDGYLYGTDEED